MTRQTLKSWLKFTLRWGIAVAGIAWVLVNTSFHDRVIILDPRTNLPVFVRVQHKPHEWTQEFAIFDTVTQPGQEIKRTVLRDELWTRPDRVSVVVQRQGHDEKVKLLAVRPGAQGVRDGVPAELLVKDPATGHGLRIEPAQVVGGYKMAVPYPLVDVGLNRLVRDAHRGYLLLALLVLPVSYFVTTFRWHLLLEALDIHMGIARTFTLNMVGAFYNTFMPGSTGGDLIKAYYASKHTPHRTRAAMSVIIDRIIGLLALIILGGIMAFWQYQIPECRQVAKVSVLLIGGTVLGLFVFYHPTLRRISGLDFLLKRLPMQKQVHKAVETMEMYGRRPVVALIALVMTFPVHITTIVSATFAGKAFGLSLSALYYWAIVPVITLVGAIPISPQGAGVMEPLAVQLTKTRGVTVSQAFALVMSIRLCQMFWNLVAGLFVLRGGYHAPTDQEQETMEHDVDEPARENPKPEIRIPESMPK